MENNLIPFPGARSPALFHTSGGDLPNRAAGVASIPTRRIAEVLNDKGMLRAIDARPDLYGSLRESWSHEQVRDPSTGGAWGVAIMFLVAGFIGLLLATGGAL